MSQQHSRVKQPLSGVRRRQLKSVSKPRVTPHDAHRDRKTHMA